MRRPLLVLPLLCALLLALAPSAMAKYRPPSLGIADNSNTSYNDPRLAALHLHYARINIPWDVLTDNSPATVDARANADLWMAKTKAQGYKAMVSFDRSRNPDKLSVNPSNKQIVQSLRGWKARWGDRFIRTISAWNEPNLNKKPRLVAGWFDALKRAFKHEIIMPGELVDASNLVSYAKKVNHYAKSHITIWGLHSYVDANNFSTRNIKRFAKSVRTSIWLTETNGVVSRAKTTRKFAGTGVAFQARATKYLLTKVARATKRLKRIYLYSWTAGASAATFDSGFVVPNGTTARPSLNVVREYLGLPDDPRATSTQ